MVGEKSATAFLTDPREIFAWFVMAAATNVSPVGTGLASSNTGLSDAPRALRASTNFNNSPSAFKLRGRST